MKKLIIITTLFVCTSKLALASHISTVDSQSCQKVKGTTSPFILVLKKGENLSESIIRCANDANLPAATLTGLGALEKTTLTYFDHKAKKYNKKYYPQFLELLSMNGNTTFLNGKRNAHIHVALSDSHYRMIGGHLGNAYVGATAEINITPLKEKLVRKMDKQTGLDLIGHAE